MLPTKSRILLNNGISVISVGDAARIILEHGSLPDHYRVPSCRDADVFESLYDVNITSDLTEPTIIPTVQEASGEEIERLLTILDTPRDNTPVDLHVKRVDMEMEFYNENDKIDFLCSLLRVIDKFNETGVVWGVGRGSSCASYILYLMRVHDVNSIKFNIPFREFSKE